MWLSTIREPLPAETPFTPRHNPDNYAGGIAVTRLPFGIRAAECHPGTVARKVAKEVRWIQVFNALYASAQSPERVAGDPACVSNQCVDQAVIASKIPLARIEPVGWATHRAFPRIRDPRRGTHYV